MKKEKKVLFFPCLNHFPQKMIYFVFSASKVSSFYIMSSLLAPSTSRGVQLQTNYTITLQLQTNNKPDFEDTV